MGAGKGRARRARSELSIAKAAAASGYVGDGDGFVVCDLGHEHWGLHGAAGLMMRYVDEAGQERYLLTHRSGEVQHGNTYSLPGGARDSYETAEQAAEREAGEELGKLVEFKYVNTEVADHGGWAYHTVHVDVQEMFEPFAEGDDTGWETHSAGWFTPEEIDKLPLHPGFKAHWESIRKPQR
jgi:8-oxo-dGTP diphosphatase